MKIYKMATFVLSFLVIVLSSILINEYFKAKSSEFSQEHLAYLDENKWTSKDFNSWSGSFISSSVAGDDLQRFKDNRPLFYSLRKRAYGYTFGINMLESYIDKLQSFNANLADKGDSIAGIRIYRSKSLRAVVENGDDEQFDDVIMVPVLLNGETYYQDFDTDHRRSFDKEKFEDINQYTQDSLVLNTSWPCPNKCNNQL